VPDKAALMRHSESFESTQYWPPEQHVEPQGDCGLVHDPEVRLDAGVGEGNPSLPHSAPFDMPNFVEY
jgi:hypothetical protein